ncbi:MAG: CBS domain-containing protein [Myxococcota bacterium]
MIAAELMTPSPVHVRPDQTLPDCAHLLLRHNIRHLPVIDDDQRLLGVIHDHAIFEHGDVAVLGAGFKAKGTKWVAFDMRRAQLTARDVAAAPVMLYERAQVREAIDLLVSSMNDVLLIFDPYGQTVGIITEHDGLRLAQGLLPATHSAMTLSGAAPLTIDRDQPVREALQQMLQSGHRHILVTERTQLYGVLSYRDLISQGAHTTNGDLLAGAAVRVTPPYTATPAMSLREAAQLMVARRIGCLPMINYCNAPVGIVTRTDLLRALRDALLGAETEPV